MTSDVLKAALIIFVSILIHAAMIRSKPEYHIEIHGDQAGFSVRTNKTTGDRCLLNEGAVRTVANWEQLAKYQPVPMNICGKP